MESSAIASLGTGPIRHYHDVQFYEDERFLSDAVGEYIGPGLRDGHPVIVIATSAHRNAFVHRLACEGLDVTAAEQEGVLTLLDAHETLKTFMSGPNPDPERFKDTIGGLIKKVRVGRENVPVRAFGEMVDLLWREGNPDGAIKLEQLWNELAETHSFSLFCAYAMGNFVTPEHAEGFQQVCTQHRRVFPTERYRDIADYDSRLREISQLQQKARALESEIENRKRLERVLRDALTARQEAEAELRQREQELTDFFENAVEGLHWVDGEGVILWANRAELEMLGYSRDEYIGHHITEFHAAPDVIADLIARLQRNEPVHNYECQLRCKDGTYRDVLINSNVLWRNGQFIHTRCFTRDITERKAIQVERERLLVLEKAARHEAESANRLKDQFLATISHELRTPLTAIAGWAELAKPEANSPMLTRALEVIERNAALQLQLVDDLLNVSRMLTGKFTLSRDVVDLAAVATLAVESLKPHAIEKSIELSINVDPHAGRICGDAARLQQIIGNLLTNALKFTPAGGGITVTLEGVGNTACLTVADTGEGIAPDFLPYVFDRFRQAESTLGRKHDGLGLGLAIVRLLVEAHDGRVHAHSDGLGKGAKFVVELPMAGDSRVTLT